MLILSTSFHVINIETAFENLSRSALLRFSSNLLLSFCQSFRLLSSFRNLKSMSRNSCCSSLSPNCLCTISSLYTSQNSLYPAIPSFDLVSFDILLVYIERSRTGGSCPKSLNNIMDLSLKASFLCSGNACLNLKSIKASILRPTMLFSSIIR